MTPEEALTAAAQSLALEPVTVETVDQIVASIKDTLHSSGVPNPYERAVMLVAGAVSVDDPIAVVEAIASSTALVVYALASPMVVLEAKNRVPAAYEKERTKWKDLVRELRNTTKAVRAAASRPVSAPATDDASVDGLMDRLYTTEDDDGHIKPIHQGTYGLENCKIICESLNLFTGAAQVFYDIRTGHLLLYGLPGETHPVIINGSKSLQPMWLHSLIEQRYGIAMCPSMKSLKTWSDAAVDSVVRTINRLSKGGPADIERAQVAVQPLDRHLETLLGALQSLPYTQEKMWWDGVPRVDRLLKSAFSDCQVFDADDEYLQIASRELILGVVYRLIGADGCVLRNRMTMFLPTDVQTIVYIYGDPGAGKTELFKALFDFFGVEGFLESLEMNNDKDTLMKLHGCVVACCDELTDTRGCVGTANMRKNFISRSTDTLRRPYGIDTDTVVRRCAIVATGNAKEIVSSDDTDRRVIPVGHIRKPKGGYGLQREWVLENRLQLFAEAIYRITVLGERPGLKPDEQALVEKIVSNMHRRLHGSEDIVLFALGEWVNGRVRVDVEPRVLRVDEPFTQHSVLRVVESLTGQKLNFTSLGYGLKGLGVEKGSRVRTTTGRMFSYTIHQELYDRLYDPDASIHDPLIQALAQTGVDQPPPVE